MAGSYNHVVDEPSGKLLKNEDALRMIETGGDVYETLEEMYGMIWWLAVELAEEVGHEARPLVEEARKAYKSGLAVSPGTDGEIPDEDE